MNQVITGIEVLAHNETEQKGVIGNIGVLCHAASITSKFDHTITILKSIFKDRLKAIYGPQHGFVTDVQDNMVESDNFIHPHFKIPVYSLYSQTRIPTKEMLQNIDTMIIDLQDVGTRVYTYISTLALTMKACGECGIKVIVLDRPNPVGGLIIEGNVREDQFFSFVGHHKIPMRHAMTIGEIALFTQQICGIKCELDIVEMRNWKRAMFFSDTGLPWVLPSPNLPTSEGALTFVGTVIFEGTNISEGRGTTRSLEIVGHPALNPYELKEELDLQFKKYNLQGFCLRPINFFPTFQKHVGVTCRGFQIHPTDNQLFRPWSVAQLLLQTFYKILDNKFSWNEEPYEYEYKHKAIDLINGSKAIRKWVEGQESFEKLQSLELKGHKNFIEQRKQVLLYY
jgi:uncharacterized protein YbbC (DUF1343 family)